MACMCSKKACSVLSGRSLIVERPVWLVTPRGRIGSHSGCTVVLVDGTTMPIRLRNPKVSGTGSLRHQQQEGYDEFFAVTSEPLIARRVRSIILASHTSSIRCWNEMRESSLPARLPAWTTASDDERQEMRTGARRRAESLDARLNAFVSVDARSPRASGALEGLPYAAKDMFRRPGHEPTCGFATADD